MEDLGKKRYEYIIGIDLGHGETSAAYCPLQWDTPVGQLEPAKDLDMGGNKKVVPSAITILDDGTAYIGDSAFNPDVLKKADVHVCFKKAPCDMNGEDEKLMIRFMQEVYRYIRENNSAILTDNNHLVYIATPSGWNEKTQDLYLQMAKVAGLPIAGVTKESRAAFVRAQHDTTSGIGKSIEKGAIVFDMGSSTLDFTYMKKGGRLVDDGDNCGASFIEKTIYKQQKEKDEVIQNFEKKYPRLAAVLLFEARKVKEQVYFDPTSKIRKTINLDDIVEDDEDFEDERFKLVFQPGELNGLLESIGYIREIEKAACDFRRYKIHNEPIYGVFLTGGASRMDFIKPLISRCWGVPEERIYRDQDPSLTISQGVAEVARMDLRTEGMDKGLEEEINQLQQSDAIYDTFIEKFGYQLWDQVIDSIAATVNNFRDAQDDYSLYDLQTSISNNVQETIAGITPNISTYIKVAVDENTIDIRKKVEDIISHYSAQGVDTQIANLEIANIEITDVDLDGVVSSISNQIAEDSFSWSGAITGAAIGGAIALILGGPLTWIIGGATLIGNWIFGDSEEEKKEKALHKDLDKNARQKVFDSIEAQWESIQENVEQSIRSSIVQNQEIKQSIKKSSCQLLQSYKESLKDARILID